VAVDSSYKDAPTRTVSAGGVDLAYRELGPKAGVPVIFLVHLAGNLDNWDPRVVDGIAAKHRVITFDNRGVGASTGKTPDTIQAMAKDTDTFIRALGFDQVDLHGFSMGGMITQVIAQDEPELVRKLILTGTGPGRWQGHQGGRVGRAARHPPRPAESPGPQAVPLLHPDRERQA
jgi:pimeloyl-ACP methyl ester carboxylesterase